MPTCPMCPAPHARLGSVRPLAALRRAPARLAGALAFRIRKIAAEPREVLVAWDQDRWADGGGYRRTPPGGALATFTALRRSNLAYVGRLGAAQKTQHGRHPEYGRLTIPQLLDHWAEHDLNHLEQIRAAHRRLSGRRSRRP